MSIQKHKNEQLNVNCMVLTISDTRTEDTDKSGDLIVALLKGAGHHVQMKEIIHDEQTAIERMIDAGCNHPEVEVIITNGGTGIAGRDVTIETIKPLFDKEITGFGELFRSLSYYEDIGSAALLSRAIAGVIENTAVFAVPGSSGAVKLAMNNLILPEVSHVVKEIKKDMT
ncbi:MogA/MoaB family molybdenum cofactor biosynthesis protein [Virgibacillus siamensis]|uniref:MogA/MoaB family molybdenum cofactor biosynthesis protein n=1 Tax=Virgibacillus siamensis TaxID=480071 RepID=UPI0009852D69|nr:MogA/MoaB family molybdenum cofactor biosynthesis protein [Virgibacillus siamensis]